MKTKYLISSIVAIVLFLMLLSCDTEKNKKSIVYVEVTDGFHILGGSVERTEKSSATLMKSGVVDENANAVLRTGMYEKFVYITAKGGGFSFEFQDGVDIQLWGGSNQETTGTLTTGTLVEDGDAMNVETTGFYHVIVIVDEQTSKYFLNKVNSWGVIGNATADGWNSDQDLNVEESLSSTISSWTVKNLELDEGEFKVRYNDNWNLEIADDVGGEVKAFTNLGGSINELSLGGKNISMKAEGRGSYTFTLNYDVSGSKFTIDTTYTGDLAPLLAPDEHSWALIGAAGNGWDDDIDMGNPQIEDNIYTYTLQQDLNIGTFKFRANKDWVYQVNANNSNLEDKTSNIEEADEGNFACIAAGEYDITLKITYSPSSYYYKVIFDNYTAAP